MGRSAAAVVVRTDNAPKFSADAESGKRSIAENEGTYVTAMDATNGRMIPFGPRIRMNDQLLTYRLSGAGCGFVHHHKRHRHWNDREAVRLR